MTPQRFASVMVLCFKKESLLIEAEALILSEYTKLRSGWSIALRSLCLSEQQHIYCQNSQKLWCNLLHAVLRIILSILRGSLFKPNDDWLDSTWCGSFRLLQLLLCFLFFFFKSKFETGSPLARFLLANSCKAFPKVPFLACCYALPSNVSMIKIFQNLLTCFLFSDWFICLFCWAWSAHTSK